MVANVKVEISPLESSIIRQVEFYFGDVNMIKDKFMREKLKEDDGWISMETMLNFKRLASLSTDTKQIMAALKKSETGLMEVSEEKEKIRRSPSNPLPENTEEAKKALEARTAYAKGYPKTNICMDDLLTFYSEKNMTIVNINMRSYLDNKTKQRCFKGSCFLTFATEEDCKKFVEAPEQKYKDIKLEKVLFQKDYFEMKEKELEERKNKNKKRKDVHEQKVAEQVAAKEAAIAELPKGAVLKITGLGEETTREIIKEKLKDDFGVNIARDDGDIAFITYNKGESEAFIRFKTENYGKELLEKITKKGKMKIQNNEVETSVLEGEEETKYLAAALVEMKNQRLKSKNHKRKNFGKGGGGNAKRGRR
jgi:lupus La protein